MAELRKRRERQVDALREQQSSNIRLEQSRTNSISEQIIAEAQTKGEKTLSDVKSEQGLLVTQKIQELDNEVAELKKRRERQVEALRQQKLSNIRLEQRRKEQSQKRLLLDDIYNKTWDKFVNSDAYPKWLEKQLKRHSKPSDVIIVAAQEKDRFLNEFKKLVSSFKVSLSEEIGRFKAGFIINRGDIRLNCSLDQEFKSLVDNSEIEINAILFDND